MVLLAEENPDPAAEKGGGKLRIRDNAGKRSSLNDDAPPCCNPDFPFSRSTPPLLVIISFAGRPVSADHTATRLPDVANSPEEASRPVSSADANPRSGLRSGVSVETASSSAGSGRERSRSTTLADSVRK